MQFDVTLTLQPSAGPAIPLTVPGVQAPNLSDLLGTIAGTLDNWPVFLPPVTGLSIQPSAMPVAKVAGSTSASRLS